MYSKDSAKARRSSRGDSASTEDVLQPYLLQTSKDWNPSTKLRLKGQENPIPNGTLGYVGPITVIMS